VKTWIVDIDGTLAEKGTRGPFDWHRVGEDTPNEPVIEVVRALMAAGFEVRYVSGRMEQCREITVDWLRKHVMSSTLPSDLFMRADGDYRPDTVVKREIFEAHFAGKHDVAGVVDDRSKVVAMWRNELGLTVLDVAGHDF
jgi:hypothetical protein